MDRDFDVMGQYRAISSKLKRRFLKKPNVAEASGQFGSLTKELKRQDCSQYAGFCCLAMARCENTLANATGEVEALVEAARLFLKAERENLELKCPSFEEHLTEAVHCYNQAIKIQCAQSNSALAACLCLEIADALRSMNRFSEAMVHYQHAAELQHHNPVDALHSMGLAASCKIDLGDFDGALAVLTEISYYAQERGEANAIPMSGGSPKIQEPFMSILAKCEVTRVLLLMLLQPSPQRIRPEHAKTLERYAWECNDDSMAAAYLSEDMFLLLQSLVMACQSRDTDALKELEKDLWPLVSTEQRHLLHLVLMKMIHPQSETVS